MPEHDRLDALGLSGVLANALPPELGTPAAPARYTIPAVFTRRPLPREVQMLQAASTREELSAAGFPGVTLKVVDRRLEIENTSLDELESGLATLIGTMLHTISVSVADAEAQRLADLRLLSDRELHRSDEVTTRASLINFAPSSAAEPLTTTA